MGRRLKTDSIPSEGKMTFTIFTHEVWGTVNGKFVMLRKCTSFAEANQYAMTVLYFSPIIKATM